MDRQRHRKEDGSSQQREQRTNCIIPGEEHRLESNIEANVDLVGGTVAAKLNGGEVKPGAALKEAGEEEEFSLVDCISEVSV